MHGSSPAAEIARSPAAWERLAKDWIVEVIERTPLADVEGLPIGWIASEAPPLIAEILGQLSDPGLARELELPPAALRRAGSLAGAWDPGAAATRVPRELAALQGVLIEALGRESTARDAGELARAASRLAEVFGAVQSAAMQSLDGERAGASPTPEDAPSAGGEAALGAWLRLLIERNRATGAEFAIGHLEIDGIDRIAGSFGAPAATRMAGAVVAVLGSRLAPEQRLFQTSESSLVVVAPQSTPAATSVLARRLARLVESSQADTSPRVSLASGVAGWPRHGAGPAELLDAAEQAAWNARAAGEEVAVAPESSLQDR